MTQPEGNTFAQYMATETQLFFAHLQEAAKKNEEGGTIPNSLFGQKAIRALKKQGGRRKGAGDGNKRKPTAFNLFIKEKMEQFSKDPSSKEVPYKEKFKDVVAQWSALSDDQKKAYTEKYADQLAGAPEAGAPTPAKRVASDSEETSSDEEKKKKKKKEKKHKHHHHKKEDSSD